MNRCTWWVWGTGFVWPQRRQNCGKRWDVLQTTKRVGEARGAGLRRAWAWLALGVSMLTLGGCLSYRLTPDQVVNYAQQALSDMNACHSTLEIEVDTDLLKDSISAEVWERSPSDLKVKVRSSANPQLRGLEFVTDGSQSQLYVPRANEVLVGAAELVRMPSVIERLVSARRDWIQGADPLLTRLIAKERENGLMVYQIEVLLQQGGSAQCWIDAGQWWVRRIAYQDTHLGTGTVIVRDLDCSAGALGSDSAPFVLDIPAGAPIKEVTVENNRPLSLDEAQLAVSFPLRTPSYLPEGTNFAVAYQLDKNLALVYTGKRSFTLMEGPEILEVPQENAKQVSVRGRQATIVPDPQHGGLVLIWQEEGLQFSIAGSMEEGEATRIADSMERTFKGTSISGTEGASDNQGQ